MSIATENFCCTRAQAIVLKAHGILQESVFWWLQDMSFFNPPGVPSPDQEYYAAFSVAELGAMLLKECNECKHNNLSGRWVHSAGGWDADNFKKYFSTQAECYADRLLYLLTMYPIKYTAEFVNTRLRNFYDHKRTE